MGLRVAGIAGARTWSSTMFGTERRAPHSCRDMSDMHAWRVLDDRSIANDRTLLSMQMCAYRHVCTLHFWNFAYLRVSSRTGAWGLFTGDKVLHPSHVAVALYSETPGLLMQFRSARIFSARLQ